MEILQKLDKRNLLHIPDFVIPNIQYETMCGSISYGVNDKNSDIDIMGITIPDKGIIFPHITGEILGFDREVKRFEQYGEKLNDTECKKEYDIVIYNIVKYFKLCMENNPNIIDSLFAPRRCVLHCSQIGNIIRDNRKVFLHKGSFFKFKGYAYSQLHKMRTKNSEGKRVKFAYNLVRLLNEIEQILIEHDLCIDRNREQLKSIRRGEWSIEEIETYFKSKERELESLYTSSTLRHSPDQDSIKQLLINCLEIHFGDLNNIIVKPNSTDSLIKDLEIVLKKHKM